MSKVNGSFISKKLLEKRVNKAIALGYTTKSKWVEFCEHFMDRGFKIKLYEAKKTVSKYVTVTDGKREYKVRFSNHRPNKGRELNEDCDFFVGITHTGVRTTAMAIQATEMFFDDKHRGLDS